MTQAIEVTADTIDQLIDSVGKAHATVIVRHSSRDIDTDESHIDFLMAVPEMVGTLRTTGKFTRAEFAAAADSVARDLSGDPEVGDFANDWLSGSVAASDGFPDRFIDGLLLVYSPATKKGRTTVVITNLRGNIDRTQYTADIGIYTGKTRYTLLYRCTDTEHAIRLISTRDNKVVAHERVDRPGPLSWADVRSWAINVAHAALRAEHTQ